jgi:O-antigen/teichoic acid export membrane protein
MLAAVTVPAACGLILVDEPLTALMVGESLRAEATRAAPWMAIAGLFSGFAYYFWAEAFQLAHRTGERALLMLAPAIAQLALTAWLAPTSGAYGAAIATCGASAIGLAVMASFGWRHLSMPVPWLDLARIGASTAAMTLAVLATPQGAGVANLVLHVVVGAFTYLASAVALDLFGARTRASAVLQAIARKLHEQFNDVFTDPTT